MDWLTTIEASKALYNVHIDILGDWYRDPWSWAELEWIVKKAPEIISARLNEKGSRRAVPLDVPKENFAIRPALLLDPVDRLCYQALVDRLSVGLIGDLRGWAYGWRLSRTSPKPGVYVNNKQEWSLYRLRLQYLAAANGFGLETDITSFFSSVDVNRLADNVQGSLGNNAVVQRLRDFLQSLQSIPGRAGIPQRSMPSSVLAHFFLRHIDEFLETQLNDLAAQLGPPILRWMDDIWMFADEPMKLRMVQIALQEELRRTGLTMNSGKTRVYEGAALLEQAREIEHSAVDGALEGATPDLQPLETLVSTLLEHPETASRTSLRFATTRIRSQKAFELVPGIAAEALRLPHAADHVARMLRDSEKWRDLVDWYIECSKLYNHSLTWTMYHLGTMFPSDETVPESLSQYWVDNLVAGDLPLLHVPLVAQRLAAWNPSVARNAFHKASQHQAYQHPFSMRALGLAGRSAGMSVADTKQLLAQFAETDVTLKFLESRKMKAPKPAPDFTGD